MKIRDLCLVLALLWLVGACGLEDYGPVELVVEPLGSSDTKLAVSQDIMAVWTDGDLVNLNGSVVAVSRTDATHAYVDNAAAGSVNSACFPADLCQTDVTANSVTVALPAEYHYRTSGGAQLLDLPMVGRSPAGEPLQMRHITAALCVVLKNQMGVSLTIDRITVTSDRYQLCGSRTVDMENITSTAAVATATAAKRKVAMVFDREALVLASNETRKVLIPVPPVGDGNHFTVTVSARHEGSRYAYSRTQTIGGALQRNVLAYAPAAVSGVTATPLFEPTGSSGQYYIRNSSDLVALSEAANGDWTLPGSTTKYSACKYRLAADIDMTGVPFSMIGKYTKNYFYGDNHVISHLTIDGADGYCGLFKNPSGIVIENLTLNDITLRHPAFAVANGSVYLGALCAHAPAGAKFTSCNVNGLKVEHSFTGKAADIYVGGLVGRLDGNSAFSSCTANIASTSYSFDATRCRFGGMVGHGEGNAQKLTFNRCVVTSSDLTVTSTQNMDVGGMVGYTTNFNIKFENNCRWSSSMTVESTYASTPTVNVGYVIGQYIKGTGGSRDLNGITTTGTITVIKNGSSTSATGEIGKITN